LVATIFGLKNENHDYIKVKEVKTMEEEIQIAFPHLSAKDKSLIVGALYRQSLIEVGHSADYHVYDLDKDLFVRKRHLAAARFLGEVYGFYRSLPDFERRIFLCDCLEHGRHYAYWWLAYTDPKGYQHAFKRLMEKTNRQF
jgi:hypothetical protein